LEGFKLGCDDGSDELEGAKLGLDDGRDELEGDKLGFDDGSDELEGTKLGCHDGRVESDGVKLGCNDGSAVEGAAVAALGLVVGAAFPAFAPGSAAAMAKPSVTGASALSRLSC